MNFANISCNKGNSVKSYDNASLYVILHYANDIDLNKKQTQRVLSVQTLNMGFYTFHEVKEKEKNHPCP